MYLGFGIQLLTWLGDQIWLQICSGWGVSTSGSLYNLGGGDEFVHKCKEDVFVLPGLLSIDL